MNRYGQSGFSLVEILIVVVIMGILAAVIVPQFAGYSDHPRYSATIDNLQEMRQAVDLYRNHHQGRLPGVAGAEPDLVFAEQITLPTNVFGQRSASSNQGFGDPNFPFGPYMNNVIPKNPFNDSRRVRTVTSFSAAPPGGGSMTDPGWVYEITSGRVKINATGQAPNGQDYWDL